MCFLQPSAPYSARQNHFSNTSLHLFPFNGQKFIGVAEQLLNVVLSIRNALEGKPLPPEANSTMYKLTKMCEFCIENKDSQELGVWATINWFATYTPPLGELNKLLGLLFNSQDESIVNAMFDLITTYQENSYYKTYDSIDADCFNQAKNRYYQSRQFIANDAASASMSVLVVIIDQHTLASTVTVDEMKSVVDRMGKSVSLAHSMRTLNKTFSVVIDDVFESLSNGFILLQGYASQLEEVLKDNGGVSLLDCDEPWGATVLKAYKYAINDMERVSCINETMLSTVHAIVDNEDYPSGEDEYIRSHDIETFEDILTYDNAVRESDDFE